MGFIIVWKKRKFTGPSVFKIEFQLSRRPNFCTHLCSVTNSNPKIFLFCFHFLLKISTLFFLFFFNGRERDGFYFFITCLQRGTARRWTLPGEMMFHRGRPHWLQSTEAHIKGIICLPLLLFFSSGQALIKLTQRIISFLPTQQQLTNYCLKPIC